MQNIRGIRDLLYLLKVEIEKLDCALSKRATRLYIYSYTSANAYILIYVYIQLNTITETAISQPSPIRVIISGHMKADIYLCNTTGASLTSGHPSYSIGLGIPYFIDDIL
jgi:hypothetical protein